MSPLPPPSIYAKDAAWPGFGEPPAGDQQVDIAVVGGGFTGISTALNLAEKGFSVHLYEAERIGYGASGRNGGQVVQGWTTDFSKLAARTPPETHRMVWDIGVMGKEIILERCRKHGIDADLRFGYLYAALHGRHMRELEAMKAEWEEWGYGELEMMPDRAALAPHINTDVYVGGLIDHASGHLQPLKYLYGLATAARDAGVVIHENTPIRQVEPGVGGANRLIHDHGTVTALKLVLAGNAYLDRRAPKPMRQRLAPVTSAIIATEPLGDNVIRDLLPGRIAVADCNTALNYYRFDARGRMLFGGRASYTAQDFGIRRDLVKRMKAVFPTLADAPIEHDWSGRIGITVDRIPHFGKIGENCWFVQGFSGHGVALTGVAGLILAEAVAGDQGRFDVLASIRHMPFPGGIFRTPALALGMAFYKLRDQLKL
ncbi:MAG: NAD(P)/FAD-dependent oxidoreductase [Candidatus Puniceispirillales bacterium]